MKLRFPTELAEQDALMLVGLMERLHDAEDDIILDFSRLSFAHPFGTALVAEALRELITQRKILGLPVKWSHHGIVKGAVSPAVTYLGHMGFFRHIGIPYGNEPGEAPGSRTYIPLTVVTRADLTDGRLQDSVASEAERLAKLVFRDESKQSMLAYCFREIIRNAFEHAEVDECVVVAQKWQGQTVEIAVVDRGRGVHASLQEAYTEMTAAEAVRRSILPGVSRVTQARSSDKWENTGFGLYVLSELGRRVGEFSLVSSGAYLHRSFEGLLTSACPFPGTGTKVRISIRDAEYFPNLLENIVREGERISGSQASGASKRAR